MTSPDIRGTPTAAPTAMQSRLEITFRDMPRRPDLEATIDRWVARLDHVHPAILHCACAVEKHPTLIRHERVNVHLTVIVPGRTITVSPTSHADADPTVKISDAFREARRQLLQVPE